MKRLEKRLVEEVNREAEELLKFFNKKYGQKVKSIVRLVGPNYIYFTNGSIVKIYFDGYSEEEVKFISGLIFLYIAVLDTDLNVELAFN